ncbi:MAG: response regulator [Planctomycetaceae bacterium]|nr:response regulator [Planctomycetaceae bacterium]
MQLLRNLSVRWKLIIFVSIAVGFSLLGSCVVLARYQADMLKRNKLTMLESFAHMIAFNSAGTLSFQDEVAANDLLKAARSEPSIEVACLYDAEYRMFAQYTRNKTVGIIPPVHGESYSGIEEDRYAQVLIPVKDDFNESETIGYLYVVSNLDDVQSLKAQYYSTAGYAAFIGVLLAVIPMLYLHHSVSSPMLRLATTAQSIARRNDFSIRVTEDREDEVGQLYHAFNTLLDHVEAYKAELLEAQNDILNAKRAADEARDIAEEANLSKSCFLANMSHEIRTPLTGILGFADLMLKDVAASESQMLTDHLKVIKNSGTHLLELINDILDISKIESGKLEYEIIESNPHQVISDAISILRVRALERGITLNYRWISDIPAVIYTDPHRFRQTLMNLIGNAIKFTDEGTVSVRCSIDETEDSAKLVVHIIDSGIGIPTDKIESIFDPFTQADNSVTRKYGGTGLGLPISRRIAIGLGGSLFACSQVGAGSTFKLTIDAGDLTGVTRMQQGAADALITVPVDPVEAELSLKGRRILLVEDGETNRKYISLVLRRVGAWVETAENGALSLDLVKKHEKPFDVILMDMQMPVMDGYTAASRLREMNYPAPIVALTAHAMKGDDQKCYQAGCSSYLTKPIDADVLVQSLARIMEGQGHIPVPDADHSPKVRKSSARKIFSSLPADDEFFQEIVREFVEKLHEQLELMHTALSRGTYHELEQLAHWLKGSGGTAGFAILTEIGAELEKKAKEQLYDECSERLNTIQDILNCIQLVDAPAGLSS